jgi:hypothetical protein
MPLVRYQKRIHRISSKQGHLDEDFTGSLAEKGRDGYAPPSKPLRFKAISLGLELTYEVTFRTEQLCSKQG